MIGHDELSRLYTLERLNKDGYINLDEVKTIDSEFAKDKLQKKDDTSTRTGGVLRQKKRDIFTSASTEVGADPDAFEMAQAWVKDGEAWFIQPALQVRVSASLVLFASANILERRNIGRLRPENGI